MRGALRSAALVGELQVKRALQAGSAASRKFQSTAEHGVNRKARPAGDEAIASPLDAQAARSEVPASRPGRSERATAQH